jgi:prepilin peptidase CpaA
VNSVQMVPIIVAVAASLAMAATDLRKFRIYNKLTIPLLVLGLVYHGLVGGFPGLFSSFEGSLLGFAILLLPFLMGGMGAGDVQLMAAIGAWLGPRMTFYVFISSSFAAGLYAITLLALNQNYTETWTNFRLIWLKLGAITRHLGSDDRVEVELSRPDRRRRVIPFAAMVCIGLMTLLIMMWRGFVD